MPSTDRLTPALERLLTQIAREHLFIETLTTRNSDRLDFHDVSVWGVKSALLAAYHAGLAAGQRQAAAAADQARNQRTARA